jgi:hypothetical protein
MNILSPEQIAWLVPNKPGITFYIPDCGEYIEHNDLTIEDVRRAEISWTFYLDPETYDNLPDEFKQLADVRKI